MDQHEHEHHLSGVVLAIVTTRPISYAKCHIPAGTNEMPCMHGRLRARSQWWASWCTSSFVRSIINNGYQLPWDTLPPTPKTMANHPGCRKHALFVRDAITELLANGAVISCPRGTRPTCCSPLNVVEQREKCRLILDLRYVNEHLRIPAFRYEGLSRAAELLCHGDWLFTLDLKSGYHHVDIHASCWTYLGFEFDGHYYMFRSLPFGLATAPYVFTQVVKQLAGRWRSRGIRLVPYVDDILFMSPTPQAAIRCREDVLTDLATSGFILNKKKSQLQPSQCTRFLGILIDTVHMVFSVPTDRVQSLQQALQNVSGQKSATPRCVARITGMLASMRLALGPLARCLTHGLITFINEGQAWNARRLLTADARRDIHFWMEHISTMNGWPIMRPRTFSAVLSCDASDSGWGASLHIIPEGTYQAAAPIPLPMRTLSSTHRELAGILWSILHFRSLLVHRHTLIRTDNQAAAFILTKGGSRKSSLTTICLRILQVALMHNLHVSISWVPRELNAEADALSKQQELDDFRISPEIFGHLDRHWGPHTIDLFATPASTQLPRYCSRLYEPTATATNAFTLSWRNENAYAFPPPHLIPATLQHAITCGGPLTLVIPQWPSAYWWPLIAPEGQNWHSHVVEAIRLPKGSKCLLPGCHSDFSGAGLPNSTMWALRFSFTSR